MAMFCCVASLATGVVHDYYKNHLDTPPKPDAPNGDKCALIGALVSGGAMLSLLAFTKTGREIFKGLEGDPYFLPVIFAPVACVGYAIGHVVDKIKNKSK